MFSDENLSITVDINLKQVDFLYVTFSLVSGLYWPFSKENNKILYVNKASNHPPTVLEQIPKGVATRLSMLSSNKDLFNLYKRPYQEALVKAGYREKLEYIEEPVSKNSRNRGRNVTWFNPPFTVSLKTNLGKEFLATMDSHWATL